MANAPGVILPPRALGHRPLLAFAERRLRERLGARLALVYAVAVGAGYALLVLLAGGDVSALLGQELRTASWIVGGLLGLSLAVDWSRLDRDEGISDLLRLRGLGVEGLEAARFLAGARRVALLVGVPALLCCAVAGARVRSLEGAIALAVLAMAAALYACVLGALVSGLSLAARVLAPAAGRLTFTALVLLPHFARELWPSMPSVPAALAWLLSVVTRAGGVS